MSAEQDANTFVKYDFPPSSFCLPADICFRSCPEQKAGPFAEMTITFTSLLLEAFLRAELIKNIISSESAFLLFESLSVNRRTESEGVSSSKIAISELLFLPMLII